MATGKRCSSKCKLNYFEDDNEDIDYCREDERIKSYMEWPVHYPVDPIRLAKSGFYYTGDKDEVVCFSCHGHVKDWNYGDVVQKKHSELFPDCDFVNNRSKNIPLMQLRKPNGAIDDEISEVTIRLSHILCTIDYDKMKSIAERLKTFINWPFSTADVGSMAISGFFFLGVEDRVQCPYCKGIISSWKPGDDPLKEHFRHFPWCSYLPEILKSMDSNSEIGIISNSQDLCGNMKEREASSAKYKLLDEKQEHAELQKLGIHRYSIPVHPQQSSLNARLHSFIEWSWLAPVSGDNLAKAGFFYIGISDHTKCFHCDGGLCNWELGDDPWYEHARWFRNCDFLRFTKGEQFIESVLKKYDSVKAEAQRSKAVPEPLMKLVDEAMKTEVVMNVVEIDVYPLYIIRTVVLQQIKETGASFPSERDLCRAASILEIRLKNERFNRLNYHDCDVDILNIDFKKMGISLGNEDKIKKANENTSAASSLVTSSLNAKHVNPEMKTKLVNPEMKTKQVNPETKTKQVNPEKKTKQVNPEKKTKQVNPEMNTKHGNPETSLQKDHCLCKICMDNDVGVVFLPCGHLLACVQCAPALNLCPMCRETIQASVRAFLP